MAKFRVKYFGSNDVPVDLIKPILDEIDAELVIERPTNDAEVIEMGRDADGIIMHGAVPFTKEIISQLKKTKVVCRTGVGVDRMDLAAAEEFGIKVCNAAGCNSIEVSEQAIGLLIAISRKLMDWARVDRELAVKSYELGTKSWPDDLVISDAAIKAVVEQAQAELKLKGPIPLDRVRDWSFAEKAANK